MTINAGYGLPSGVCLGVAGHIPLSEFATIHIAVEASRSYLGNLPGLLPVPVSAGIALGLPR